MASSEYAAQSWSLLLFPSSRELNNRKVRSRISRGILILEFWTGTCLLQYDGFTPIFLWSLGYGSERAWKASEIRGYWNGEIEARSSWMGFSLCFGKASKASPLWVIEWSVGAFIARKSSYHRCNESKSAKRHSGCSSPPSFSIFELPALHCNRLLTIV